MTGKSMSAMTFHHIPKTDRERELADFWYAKGYTEAEMMAKCKANKRKANKRKVSVVVTDKLPKKRAARA